MCGVVPSQPNWLSVRLFRYVGVSRLCDWGLYVGEQESKCLLLRAQPTSSATSRFRLGGSSGLAGTAWYRGCNQGGSRSFKRA